MSGFHLAELNIARLSAPIDAPQIAEFREALDQINSLAEASPGFVWRATGTGFDSESPANDTDPLLLINLSVWETAEDLGAFAYRGAHAPFVKRAHLWFESPTAPQLVLWWIAAGTRPCRDDAFLRLDYLRAHGATAQAFDFKTRFAAPSRLESAR